MAEYIEREELLKFIEETNTDDEWIVNQYNADWIYSFIESQPTADVVEVVRCKDCKHYVAEYCTRDIKGRTNMFYMQPTDFCSYGERKENIKTCETCIYYDNDRADTPCCSCVDGENWEWCNDK